MTRPTVRDALVGPRRVDAPGGDVIPAVHDIAPAQVRQGDVLLVPVARVPYRTHAIPRDRGRVVLAYGEVTGHAHAIRSLGAALLELRGERYLQVSAAVTLEHEEHGPIDIAPGAYRVVIQREYVPADVDEPGVRRVVD